MADDGGQRVGRDFCICTELPSPYRIIHVFEETQPRVLDFHSHGWYHVNHVTGGTVCLQVAGRIYEIRQGQTFVLPPYIPHRLEYREGFSQFGMDILLQEDVRGISQLVRRTFENRHAVLDSMEVQHSFDELYFSCISTSPLQRLKTINTAETLLLEAVENGEKRGEDAFKKEFLHMLAYYKGKSLTLREMCVAMGMSKTHLERQSVRQFGCGAVEYSNRKRLQEACVLLQSDRESVGRIAEKLGFYDESHFSRFFKERMGIPPSAYRKKAEENCR